MHHDATNPNKNLYIKYSLFGALKLTRNAINKSFIYNGYKIAFNEYGS